MKRPVFGFILILIGCVFLFDNLGWTNGLAHYIFKWYNILILIGLIQLVAGKPKGALIFFIIGGFFWFDRFFDIDLSDTWPIILIAIGILFILRNVSSNKSSDNEFDEVSIFSGTEKKYTSPTFNGGKVTTLFGGTELDLTECTPTDDAVIDIFTMFGGTEITVPENWNVQLDATAILGGVSDERKPTFSGGAKIRVKGFVMFGGLEIRS